MRNKTLMIQGTTSNAGKSAVVTGLCRLLARRACSVAPFKPQNMALNSAVTVDGGEIGRAQAVQAEACGLEPHSDMGPILLKPNSSMAAQVIIQGRVVADMAACDYHNFKPRAMSAVLESYRRLCQRFEYIIVEGAGSPAEINLRQGDIANMGFAEAVDCPVIIVADIDRGGVFASLIGTMSLLSESESQRVKGFIINRFRGDVSLLRPGVDWLEQHTGKPVLAILPYLEGLHLESEDSLSRESKGAAPGAAVDQLCVVVPVTPRLANHTDFDALGLHPQVNLIFVKEGEPLPPADLIILGGSKNVRDDLAFVRRQGWDTAIMKHLRFGGKLIGICGGFQMLGRVVNDPSGLESEPGSSAGLALLDMETTLEPVKQLRRVKGTLCLGGAVLSGYEIHMGVSSGAALNNPATVLNPGAEYSDGAISADNQILGTYIHGLFDSQLACQALLSWAGLVQVQSVDYAAVRNFHIDRLADALENNLNLDLINAVLPLPVLPESGLVAEVSI